jgi:hypothetical protein
MWPEGGLAVADEQATAIETEIASMWSDHERLIAQGRQWSLAEMFSTPDCEIDDYCRDFTPNRFGEEACAAVESFCRRHGIWLEDSGVHYNSMTPYLHPGAVTAERMTIIGIYNAILFWFNDTAGREKFAHLTPDQQHDAHITVGRLCRLLETRCAPADPAPIEAATTEFLSMLTMAAEPEWLRRFLASTIDHLRTAIRDQNIRARGGLLTVEEYIDLRARVSGMYPAIELCEFGRDDYLPWRRIGAAGLGTEVERLRRLTTDIGALMNDMFSFEKECIADRADFNLLPICLLNTPGQTLADAVGRAGRMVLERFTEFRLLSAHLDRQCGALGDQTLAAHVAAHVADLRCCVQATWVWQNITRRYKGTSIFTENRERDISGDPIRSVR